MVNTVVGDSHSINLNDRNRSTVDELTTVHQNHTKNEVLNSLANKLLQIKSQKTRIANLNQATNRARLTDEAFTEEINRLENKIKNLLQNNELKEKTITDNNKRILEQKALVQKYKIVIINLSVIIVALTSFVIYKL